MRPSSIPPLLRTICANFCCSASSGVSSSRPVMPMMAFIGVRISWLMLARNSLFARVAASARVRASICSEMSLYVTMARFGLPEASLSTTVRDRSIHR